jgi:pimeloyl-ACP methyl ester carboxylesterase
LAVDLPGHGFGASFPVEYQAPQDLGKLSQGPAAIAGTTLKQTADHVIDTVRQVAQHGPVVLVGHSRGGVPITAVGNAIPDLVSRIVYVSAWCPVDVSMNEYVMSPENSTSALNDTQGAILANPMELGAIRLNFRTADRDLLAKLKHALFADGTDKEFMALLNTLEPDEMLDADVQAGKDTWGRIPRTYVRLVEDLSMPIALQDRFIREADAMTPDNPFQVHDLDSSHLRFLVHPKQFVDVLTR